MEYVHQLSHSALVTFANGGFKSQSDYSNYSQ